MDKLCRLISENNYKNDITYYIKQSNIDLISYDNTDNFEIVVQKFYVNYNNWHQDYRNNPLPEQVVVRMDLQLEVIKRALEQPVNEERRNKIIKQIEALSFMYASVASLLNWPDDKINF
jgi:hypothetical protein